MPPLTTLRAMATTHAAGAVCWRQDSPVPDHDHRAPVAIEDLAHDEIVLRRLTTMGYTEGEAVEQPEKMRQLSVLEKRLIARAWQATEQRAGKRSRKV